jgi:hypothetical protein
MIAMAIVSPNQVYSSGKARLLSGKIHLSSTYKQAMVITPGRMVAITTQMVKEENAFIHQEIQVFFAKKYRHGCLSGSVAFVEFYPAI